MRVQVVRIGDMGMYVPNGFMAVLVAMLVDRFPLMDVRVVTVIMDMGVLMFGCLMKMLMSVGLHQMQEDTNEHQDSANDKHPGTSAVAHRKCAQCSNERCKGEDRPCAPCAERPLRKQIQAQAQPISSSSNSQ